MVRQAGWASRYRHRQHRGFLPSHQRGYEAKGSDLKLLAICEEGPPTLSRAFPPWAPSRAAARAPARSGSGTPARGRSGGRRGEHARMPTQGPTRAQGRTSRTGRGRGTRGPRARPQGRTGRHTQAGTHANAGARARGGICLAYRPLASHSMPIDWLALIAFFSVPIAHPKDRGLPGCIYAPQVGYPRTRPEGLRPALPPALPPCPRGEARPSLPSRGEEETALPPS
jgi:hypothetical protein